MVEKAQRRGPLEPLMSWGPEKLLIRCSKKAIIQQRAGSLGLRLSSPREQERHNADGHKSGGQYIAVLLGLQLPLTVKPWVTLFQTLTIKWEVHIFLKKSSLVLYHCVVVILSAWICIWQYNKIPRTRVLSRTLNNLMVEL